MDANRSAEDLPANVSHGLRTPINAVTADIPVIIFPTADDDSSAKAKGLALGAMDFFKKLFMPGFCRSVYGRQLSSSALTG